MLRIENEEVLIETYWNVKFIQFVHIVCRNLVLIETYWNVKKIIQTFKDWSPLY